MINNNNDNNNNNILLTASNSNRIDPRSHQDRECKDWHFVKR